MSSALFFNDNNNGSINYGEINITDEPVCAGKGFSCPALYNPMDIFSCVTTFADIVIIPFLIYLTIAKVKDSLFKYFTLNLMAVCAIITIADLTVDVLNVVNLFANLGEGRKALYRIRRWGRRFLSFGNIWFHALELYASVICYLPYVKPIFYAKHFVHKSQKLHYVTLHISLLLWNILIDFIREQFSFFMPYHLTNVVLYIASSTIAMMGSIVIYKYKLPGVSATYTAKLRRRRLFSFIIYCYATQIIFLPRFIYSFMSIICFSAGCEYQLQEAVFFDITRHLIHISHELNSIAIGLCTITALEPYRHAILSICRKEKSWSRRIQPMNKMIVGDINMACNKVK